MAVSVQPRVGVPSALRTIVAAVVALIAGLLLGMGLALGAVGLLPFIAGGTLDCSVNANGSVTTCTDSSGQVVKVPHHIHIKL